LIFLVDPGQESLVGVVENTSAFGPVTVKAARLEETVSLFKEEVIVNQLLLLFCSHRSERVISSSKLTSEIGESQLSVLLNFVTLLTGNTWSKRELG
jgi:hypothetical protein